MDKFTAPYKEHSEAIKNITNELQNFKGPETIETIWKKYPEFKKNAYLENLYGDLQKSAQNGAGVTELGQDLNTTIDRIISDQYFKGGMFKSIQRGASASQSHLS